MTRVLTVVTTVLLLTACAPEVGSERWCKALEEKPKGDWSSNEAADYTKHCVLRAGE
jgi:hypothetical protein